MLTALLDDAALFPPGLAPMPTAVAAHLGRRGGPDDAYVGPFVCPVSRLAELGEALGDATIEVSLVVDLPVPRELPPGVSVVALELPDLSMVCDLPSGPRVFVERPWDADLSVPAGTMLKLRCGGAYVPSACQLGVAIRRCVEESQPFKLTAGLHHAVRTGGEHGLLNVLAAVDAALVGDDPVPVLLADDPADLVVRDPRGVRALLRSVGTCSIDEPLAELRGLGLVA